MKIRNTLCVFLSGVFLLSATLWGLSYASIYYRGRDFLVTAYAGHFQFLRTSVPWANRPHPEKYPMGWKVRGYHGLGVLWWPWYSSGPSYLSIHMSLWMPTALTGILFTYAYLPFYRRRKRRRDGLCPACGYDLRASTERCPECGRTIASP